MLDDGANGDIEAADDVYTVKMPKSLQKNRHLVRYRILATDTTGILFVALMMMTWGITLPTLFMMELQTGADQ